MVFALGLVLLAGCRPERGRPTPPGEAQAASAPAALLARLDSAAVLYLPETDELAVWSARGIERWRVRIDEGRVLGSPAVAPDSSVFLQTERELLAFGTDGELAWRLELPRPTLAAALLGPVALRDSGVVMATATDQVEVFSAGDTPRCKLHLPIGSDLRAPPQVAPNGSILIATREALFAFGDDCALRCERPAVSRAEGGR